MKYFVVLLLYSCSMLGPSDVDEKSKNKEVQTADVSVGGNPTVKETSDERIEKKLAVDEKRLDALELSVAQIRSMMTEIQSFLKSNNEKIKVLEKAFSLGIIPDRTSGLELTEEHFEIESSDKNETEIISDSEKSLDSNAYSLKLDEARVSYLSGKHKRAIELYTDLGKTFSSELTGNNQYYWIGLSYFRLKEFKQSLTNFQQYIKYNPYAYYVADAKVYMAMCYKEFGLQAKAEKLLKSIVTEEKTRPEIKEMAQYQIQKMEQSM